ncbi:MAG: chemotaxis protein CheA [Planctomycetaceae bacterium]|nr:chemotaxis protein CheA [Planctomycetaceae bacterium]
MGLKASIQAAAKAAVLTDAGDLQSLVVLSELLRQLATDAAAEGVPEVARTSSDAAELSEAIVLRQVNDVEKAFQKVMDAVRACDTAVEQASAPPREPADPELLLAWVTSCESTLPEIEHLAVTAESRGFTGETAAEIRRRIHTLKGECGVLSLSEAQSLCHELESLIDASTTGFPIEAVLVLCDWMKSLTAALRNDPAAAEPDTSVVRSALSDASNGSDPATEAATTTATTTANAATPAAPQPEAAVAPVENPFADLDSIPYDQRVVMDLENVDENAADFALEAREHLANAETAVLTLESGATDPEQVNIVFRAFHTIKGVAGFLNLPRIVEVAHAAEFLLDKVRSNKIALSPNVLELVLASSDLLGQLIGMLGGGDAPRERDLKILVRRLEAACEGRFPGAAPTEASTPATDSRPVPAPAGASVSAGAKSLAPVTAAPAVNPSATDVPAASVPAVETASTPSTTAPSTSPTPAAAPAGEASSTAAKHGMSNKADQTVKVSTQRMDALVNLVGELVIAQLMVVQDPVVGGLADQRVQRNLSHLGKIVRDLQETSMSLRMVTLKSTFQKMARLVRDVAAKAGKRIQLEVEGEDVELDRNVVEEIGDPLVHMIRNACDHGIEPAADRVAVGKTETGTLRLRAFHSGGSIVIEVEDDGRGLSRERIIRKCLEKGLIDPSRNTAEIPDSEVFNYIFLPGFSTAEKVTDISGRGVGMDVVRRNIEALRGSVEIRSTPGKGSVFSMRLPLTMAIIDGMVVRVGSQRYIVPTLNIERSFRPTAEQLTTVLGKGEVAKVRDALLPIHRLQRMFNLAEGERELEKGLLLVLENGKRRACVFVDEILGQQQVVIKTLGDSQPQIRGVSGGAILGDGRVALIVDVGGLLESATTALVAA